MKTVFAILIGLILSNISWAEDTDNGFRKVDELADRFPDAHALNLSCVAKGIDESQSGYKNVSTRYLAAIAYRLRAGSNNDVTSLRKGDRSRYDLEIVEDAKISYQKAVIAYLTVYGVCEREQEDLSGKDLKFAADVINRLDYPTDPLSEKDEKVIKVIYGVPFLNSTKTVYSTIQDLFPIGGESAQGTSHFTNLGPDAQVKLAQAALDPKVKSPFTKLGTQSKISNCMKTLSGQIHGSSSDNGDRRYKLCASMAKSCGFEILATCKKYGHVALPGSRNDRDNNPK